MNGFAASDTSGIIHETGPYCGEDRCHPVVVIDPESAEDVERLAACMMLSGCRSTTDLAAALREFAAPTPPRPDEPQGLGAVVEDAEGLRWIRVGVSSSRGSQALAWQSRMPLAEPRLAWWSDVKAVRVLSEGVTP